MSATIQNQSRLNRATENRFWMIFNLPDPLKNLGKKFNQVNSQVGIDRDSVRLSLTSVSVPNINVKAEDISYGGGSLAISSHSKTEYGPVKVKFKIDNIWANYFTIYEWLNYIRNESEGHFDAENLTDKFGINEYTTSISIVALDEKDKPKVQWFLTYAFPTDLSAVTFDYSDSKEIECEATFVFAQLKIRNLSIQKAIGDVDA